MSTFIVYMSTDIVLIILVLSNPSEKKL